jgi:hypothetical protein
MEMESIVYRTKCYEPKSGRWYQKSVCLAHLYGGTSYEWTDTPDHRLMKEKVCIREFLNPDNMDMSWYEEDDIDKEYNSNDIKYQINFSDKLDGFHLERLLYKGNVIYAAATVCTKKIQVNS